MLVGLVGDVHGRVYHLLAALVTWQEQTGNVFDLVVQVGDMGAYPRVESMDHATTIYADLDDAERDFVRFLDGDGAASTCLRRLRDDFYRPVHFINGNHDDLPWLRSKLGGSHAWTDIDPLHILRYVRNGAVIGFDSVRIAFLGWEDEHASPTVGYSTLMSLPSGSCDVLVTHKAPYGASRGRDGRVQGSPHISVLVEALQPRVHVFGHLHHQNGPHTNGRTVSLGLSSLVASARWQPDTRGLKPGCIAVLDTDTYQLVPITDAWLTSFPTPFRFQEWCATRYQQW